MFLATNMPFLNQRYDVHVHTYATLQELKSKVSTVNSQNRLSSPRKSFKNKFFFAKYDCFFLATYACILNDCEDGNTRTYVLD